MSTVADLIEAIKAVAAENPDRVYEKESEEALARYFHGDGGPGCLVGHGMARCGVKPVDDDHNSYHIAEGIRFGYFEGLEDEGTVDQRSWLSDVQEWQDGGQSWGNAVHLAED